MFDDLVKNKKINTRDYNIKAFCPNCGSTDILHTGEGVFIPGRKFRQEVICNVCDNKWYEIISENMEVINLET